MDGLLRVVGPGEPERLRARADAARIVRRHRRRRRARRIGTVVLLVLSLLAAEYWGYPRWTPLGGRSFNRGENGLWLRYTWYFGLHNDAKIRALARQLARQQIRTAYFHIHSIRPDGTLQFHYPDNARRLIAGLHRNAPNVRVIAWVYAGNPLASGNVNLADTNVRARMVAEAVWLTRDCGFDGVQWDYEICPDGSASFLLLLRETRQALPAGKRLDAAVPMVLAHPTRDWGWSTAYLGEVARLCDQVAVMIYDSSVWLPRFYVWLTRQQVVETTQAVAAANPRCRVLLGVPTYGKASVAHHPHAENLRMALKGVREGLASAPPAARNVFAGIALFADYTTDDAEWRLYETGWRRR